MPNNVSPTARVLIVEDEPLGAQHLKLHLENRGYIVVGMVSTGEAAIETAISSNPDLVLMDIVLSGEIDGIEAAAVIQRDCDIPVLYLTAYDEEKLVRRAKITEPYAYILKPFNERELTLTIEMALVRHQLDRTLRLTRDNNAVEAAERAKELQSSEERLRDFLESASDWFWEQDEEFRFTEVVAFNENEIIGRAQAAIGHTRWHFAGVNSEKDEHWRHHIDDLLAHRSFRDFRYDAVGTSEKNHVLSVSGKPIFDEDGTFKGYRGTVTDVTELVQARQVNERFLQALEQLPEVFILWDADERLVFRNNHARKLMDPVAAELAPGTTYETWVRAHIRHGVAPEAIGREEAWVEERLANFRNLLGTFEVEREGRWYQVRLQKLSDGSVIQSASDVHDLKLSEEQLRRSQRLKAVGQLTGGVAHDFNNLLAALAGYAVLLEQRIPDDKTTQRYLEAINQVVARGAFLTNRLLSFSRQQALSPATTAVNGLVLGLEDMLRRSLGEAIELKIDLASGSCLASIDSHQFEDALLNLTINARDAMPNGGTLRIETANVSLDEAYAERQEEVTPGDYVLVTVSDSGTGMPPEIIEKAYEPFFTTKDVGEGSGLGLSMVYGFAKQSNGHLSIDSEVGQGTTIKLYVPCSLEVVAHRY